MNRAGSHIIHVLSFLDGNTVKIGRGHESELRIPDISVSRIHAIITLENGNYVLYDKDSKFGTLVMNSAPLVITARNNRTIQVSRSIVTFSLKTPSILSFPSCLPCCGRNNEVAPDPLENLRIPTIEVEPQDLPEEVNFPPDLRDYNEVNPNARAVEQDVVEYDF